MAGLILCPLPQSVHRRADSARFVSKRCLILAMKGALLAGKSSIWPNCVIRAVPKLVAQKLHKYARLSWQSQLESMVGSLTMIAETINRPGDSFQMDDVEELSLLLTS